MLDMSVVPLTIESVIILETAITASRKVRAALVPTMKATAAERTSTRGDAL